MSDRKLYLRLGLEPGATPSELRRAFRNLSLKLHPDASRDGTTSERFILVSRAYQILSEREREPRRADGRWGETGVPGGEAGGLARERSRGTGRSPERADAVRPSGRRAAGLGQAALDELFALGAELESGSDPAARKAAAGKIGLSGKRSAWVFLRKGLYDESPEVVEACVRAASVLGLAQGGGEIAGAYERAEPALRDAMLEMAAETRDGLFAAMLEAARGDPDPVRRARAARASALADASG